MSESAKITLTIDGKEVTAENGMTLLEAARANDIEIPTLCHDPRLPPYGSCLVCVVRVEGMKNLIMSCTTAAAEGMQVITQSEEIAASRKAALEMLLSNHYADCRGPCYEKCPADVDVQGYLALAHEGRDKEALELIRETNPLPLVCGRVCVRYCEGACARNDVDNAVAINFIKRYVSDLEHDNLDTPVKPESNNHRVAVVGGGPGGLTAAYYLARQGCQVTIFEANPKLGGMLRYGIPDYRLDQQVLDKEIQYILDFGVEVKTETRLGEDFTLDDLKAQGFETIFVALGAQKAKAMRVKNEEAPGVEGGIVFLDRVTKEGTAKLSGHVVVVGGGNTAVDASRTALRCGADKVSILYRRTRKEMPADEVEVEDAIEEGVNIDFLVAPLEVLTDESGKLRAIHCQRMELGEPDASGRRRPVPIKGSEFDVECSLAIAAIGQDCDLTGIRGSDLGEIEETRWATIVTKPETFATNIAGVFAGGDVATGPEAAIDAIGHGRKAAKAMLDYMQVGELPTVKTEFLSRRDAVSVVPESYWERFPKVERSKMQQVAAKLRIENFEEVDIGIAPEAVVTETARCLSCGCSDVFTCDLKRYGTEYDAKQGGLRGKANRYEADLSHAFVALDPNKCIVCGRCVRTCDDLQGVAALGFINRGFAMVVKPALGRPLDETPCISCGNCIDACPTGAITFKLPFERPGPWRTEEAHSLCNHCGVGCEIVINRKNESIWHVTAAMPDAYTPGELCVRGRFGHRAVLSTRRLKQARVREGGEQRPATLEEAVKSTVKGLRGVVERHGSEALGFFISPKATNEELFLFSKMTRQIFGSKNLGSLYHLLPGASYAELDDSLGATASTVTRAEIEQADVVVLVNADVRETSPVLGFSVHRAAQRGADVVVLGSSAGGFGREALWLQSRRGSNTVVLSAVASHLIETQAFDRAVVEGQVEGLDAYLQRGRSSVAEAAQASGLSKEMIHHLANLITDPTRRVVFIYGADAGADKTAGDLRALTSLLLLSGHAGMAGSGLMLCQEHSNAQGQMDLHATPEAAEGLRAALDNQQLKGLFIFGEDFAVDEEQRKLFEAMEFSVVVDMHDTQTAGLADVALPGSAYAESEGSATSSEGKVVAFERVFSPPSGKTGFEVLSAIYGEASGEKAPDFAAVRQQIAARDARYAPLGELKAGESFHRKLEGKLRFPAFVETPEQPAQTLFVPCYSTIDGITRKEASLSKR
ncbi:MAG: FAD-dependent oxidoreductase [Deltaproteobacteria bacterium]|nr:FAD-dependent oxidoreductase [Deltaproteobacteria bacterium]